MASGLNMRCLRARCRAAACTTCPRSRVWLPSRCPMLSCLTTAARALAVRLARSVSFSSPVSPAPAVLVFPREKCSFDSRCQEVPMPVVELAPLFASAVESPPLPSRARIIFYLVQSRTNEAKNDSWNADQ